jgi:osmotically-inducible protein OsmY
MTFGSQIPDKTLQKNVDRKLMQKCSGSKIVATVRSGDATITGTIKSEHERRPIIRCVTAVQGIRRVNDQLTLAVKPKLNDRFS